MSDASLIVNGPQRCSIVIIASKWISLINIGVQWLLSLFRLLFLIFNDFNIFPLCVIGVHWLSSVFIELYLIALICVCVDLLPLMPLMAISSHWWLLAIADLVDFQWSSILSIDSHALSLVSLSFIDFHWFPTGVDWFPLRSTDYYWFSLPIWFPWLLIATANSLCLPCFSLILPDFQCDQSRAPTKIKMTKTKTKTGRRRRRTRRWRQKPVQRRRRRQKRRRRSKIGQNSNFK